MKKILFLLAILSQPVIAQDVVKMVGYSSVEGMDKLVKTFNDTLGKDKNITLTYVEKKKELDQMLKEGAPLNADLVQIKDAGNFFHTKEHGTLAPVNSAVLEKNIPAHLRDKDNTWFGMTKRARIIYYNSNYVTPDQLSTYEDLGNPYWRNKLCLRTSRKMYNSSMVAFFLEEKGEKATREMLEGWMANNPKIKAKDMTGKEDPLDGVIKAVHEGDCWVGVANTYYLGHFIRPNDPSKPAHPDTPVRAFFPNQDSYGSHVNVKAYGVTSESKNFEAAKVVLEFLSTPVAQKIITHNTHETPVNVETEKSSFHNLIGEFKENKDFDLEKATTRKQEALDLTLEMGWN
jgi:iron(III) transport system substrate-binding protein